ncbi:MAG: S9 family peptidase [Janthinobacterium lividum]
MAKRRKQKITPRALLELKMPGEVQVAPDSLRVAYGVSETDWDENGVVQHLYVLKIGAEAEPRQITRGGGSETQPRWSPDGNWLAFLSSRDDEGGTDYDADADPEEQVWLLPMDGLGGEAEKLTDAPEGIGDYDWLPDSSGIVYLAQEPRPKPLEEYNEDKKDRKDDAVVERFEKFRQQIWRIDRESKKPKLIHAGDFGLGEISVSPDGKSVAFTTNYTGEVNDYHKSDVWVVDIESSALHAIADGPGGKFHPVWSRDSLSVYYIASLDPELSYSQPNLYSVPSAGGSEPINLTAEFPYDLIGWHGVYVDAKGHIYALAAVGTTTAVFRWDGSVWSAVVQNDEHLHDYHVAPNGGVAYVSSSTIDVPELCWLGPGKKRPETLTDLNQDWADGYALAPTQVVTWKSPDGLEIEGLLTLPPGSDDSQKLPMIVNLHGGPHGRTVQALSPYTAQQVWAAEGYAVLSPNYRGSEGYGNAFSTANRHDLGGGDVSDILAGIDQAIAENIADPEKLAVIGSSYGGYLVNWLIGKTNRFQAAVSQFGIFSLATDFSNSQAPRWETEYLGGYPWDKPELYAERSPSTYLKDIQTPVLLMHGEGDSNTFIANSQEMYQALHLLGKTAEYVHYPREGHGFGEPQHRLDELRRCLNWFDKYLNGGARTVHRTGDKLLSDGWELIVTTAILETYAGRTEEGLRYVEIALVLHDTTETRRTLTLKPADFSLTRIVPPGRPTRPLGLPVSVLGQKALAESANWSFSYVPGKDDRALTAPIALAFRLPATGGTYQFRVRDFPPVTLDVPAAEKTDEKKNEENKDKQEKD